MMSDPKIYRASIPSFDKQVDVVLASDYATEKAAREKAERRAEACAEIQEVLQRYAARTDIAHEAGVVDALKSDAGRDYIHKSKLDAVLEVLEQCVEALNVRHEARANLVAERALTAADRVLKENQDETTKG